MSDTLEAIRKATTAQELADALQVWAIECADEVGETPQWWVEQLRRLCEDRSPDV